MSTLSRIPGIVWVILLAAVLVAAGSWGIYHRGVRVGEMKVHRQALGDSVHTATTKVAVATAASDRAIVASRRVAAGSAVALEERERARHDVIAALDSAPPAVVQLVHTDDALLVRNAVTIATQAAAIDTLLDERHDRQQLDTLRTHETELAAQGDGPSRLEQLALVVVVLEVLNRLRQLLQH
jgi:hypothetical protein